MGERESGLFFQRDFGAAEFAARRARVCAAVGRGVVVVASAEEVRGFDPVRQDNDFYYLAGVDSPHAYLTIDAGSGKSVLYLPPRNEKHEKSDGPTLCDEDGAFVLSRTGIDEVRPMSRLVGDVSNLGVVWVARAAGEGYRQCQDTLRHHARSVAADPLDGRLSRETHLMARLATLSPRAEFRDVSPVLQRLRLVKSAAEVEVMRRAGRLAAVACAEAMRSTAPGVFEFQLGAVADYVYAINGAQGQGYRPIIAGGKNIWMMHYWRNNCRLADGDLVILDCAPDWNNYTSDIGRMWPVNGTFSAVQRELYGFVLAYHKVLLSLVRAGRTKAEVLAEGAAKMQPILEGWKWSRPIYRAAAVKLLESKRPLSHGVGMAVHEAADWAGPGLDEPMAAGLVFAVDPELFIPEEETYIRVEDTVVVTEGGCENLTAECPAEVGEIEARMREKGLLQGCPAVMGNAGR
jgi:Xaa-Pro aminopeptidase